MEERFAKTVALALRKAAELDASGRGCVAAARKFTFGERLPRAGRLPGSRPHGSEDKRARVYALERSERRSRALWCYWQDVAAAED